MKFTVIWKPEAVRALAKFYVGALEQGHNAEAITAAAAEIDSLLSHRPDDRGESRSGAWRVLIELPLGVEFHVLPDRQEVHVVRAHYSPRHG